MKKDSYTFKIILCLFLFFIISALSIYSARNITSTNLENILIKQIIYYLIGVFFLIIAYRHKNNIIKHAILWYIGFNFLLLILLIIGVSINGSKCWLIIGNISFQPSEFMKIALILVIANILENHKRKKERKVIIEAIIVLLIPSILTFLEPDTGVVIIYFVIVISMILYKGINKKWYYITIISILIIVGLFSYLYIAERDLLIKLLGSNLFYRMDRLLNWSQGIGYQLENSLIAIGSAGINGFGIGNIPLYYPEASTDFIFTSYSSSFGFIGNIILIMIIIIFNSTILNMIKEKIKKKDQYILVGIFAMILYQQIQNIGMTIGLIPITGITLPFISYGGSSLISYMFICGLILKISHDNNLYIN